MKWCDIHGPIDVPVDVTACPAQYTNGRACMTVLTDQPNRKFRAMIAAAEAVAPHATQQPNETPEPNTRARVMGRKQFNQEAFLAAFEENFGNVTKAAAAANLNPWTHYEWLKTDPEYKTAFEQSTEIARGRRKSAAIERAFEGTLEPRTVAGQQVMVRVFSDRLAERFLEADFPEEFSRNMQHRLVDKKGDDRELISIAALDKLIREADARDKEAS